MLLPIYYHCLLFISQIWAAGFEDVPEEVFKSHIATRLQPGSLARLGLVSVQTHHLSEAGLSQYKNDDNFDLRHLYSVYHTADDDFERDSVRRLIEAKLPEKISDCYTVQSKYEICKKQLFTGDHMNYSCISEDFLELSLMLLTHKKFLYDPELESARLCSPLLIDAFIASLEKIHKDALLNMFRCADPCKLGPAFAVLADPTPQLQMILESGDLGDLLDSDIEPMTMLYVLTQCEEENMELILSILKRYNRLDELYDFVPNFMNYDQMQAVTKYIIKNSAGPFRPVGVAILNSMDSAHFLDYYPAMRGESTVSNALEYLGSFDASKGFEMGRPEAVSTRDLLEVALMYEYPESVLSAILSSKSLDSDLPLMFAAWKRAVSPKIMVDIVGYKQFRWDDFRQVQLVNPVKRPLDMEVFKHFARVICATEYSFGQLQLLSFLQQIDSSVPRLEYLKHILLHNRPDRYTDPLASYAFSFEGTGSYEMSLEILKYCFEHGVNVWWKYPGDPPVAVQFLESQPTDALLKYTAGYMQNPFRNLFGLAMSIISKRPGGYPFIKSKFFSGNENSSAALQGTLILLKARHEGLCHKKAAPLIASDTDFFYSSEKFVEMDETEDLDRIFEEMFALRDTFRPDAFIELYVTRKIQQREPVSSMRILKFVTLERFKGILSFRDSFSDLLDDSRYNTDYYKPRLLSEKFFKKPSDTDGSW